MRVCMYVYMTVCIYMYCIYRAGNIKDEELACSHAMPPTVCPGGLAGHALVGNG